MNVQTEKLDLIQWVLTLTDRSTLDRLHALRTEKSAAKKVKSTFRLSSLRGKASGMTDTDIDAQFSSIRDEWVRNI